MKRMNENAWRVLEEIARFHAENGYGPAFRDICDRFCWASTNSAHDPVARLREHGLVTSNPKLSRSLRLTDKGRSELELRHIDAIARRQLA